MRELRHYAFQGEGEMPRTYQEEGPTVSPIDFSNLALPDGSNDVQMYDFEGSDFGLQLEITKDEMNGKVIYIVGVSDSEFESEEYEKKARSIRFHFPTDAPDQFEPWGILLSSDSPAIRQAEGQIRKNKVPFTARIVKVKAERSSRTYWTLEPVRSVFNQDGQLAGWRTVDGELIDNSAQPLKVERRSARRG